VGQNENFHNNKYLIHKYVLNRSKITKKDFSTFILIS
jgi:hypothetical protein